MPQSTFYGRKNVPITIQPNIGLDASARQSVIDILNLLQADEAVLSLKTHHADEQAVAWDAPELRPLFDAQFNQINTILSEIMERVNILGGSHISDSEKLLDAARLGGELNTLPGLVSILADQEAIIRFVREDARKCSEMYEDQGTYTLLVGVMRIHEKMAWILRSHIAPGQLGVE